MYIAGKQITITNAGGAYPVDIDGGVDTYYFQGTATLAAGYSVSPSGVPTKQSLIKIFYNGNVTTSAANQVTIFGTALSFEQALKGKCLILCTYDFTATAWVVSIVEGYLPSQYEGVVSTALAFAALAQTITLTYSSAKSVQRITGTGTLLADVSVTSSGTFPDGYLSVTFWDAQAVKGASTITILGASLSTEQALNGNVVVLSWYELATTSWRSQIISGTQSAAFIVPVSFETGEICENKFIAPCDGTFTNIDSFVTLLIDVADDATIQLEINGTPVTDGDLTIAGGSALDTQDSNTPSALNVFSKGDTIGLVASKTTPGGKALVTVRYTTLA